MTERWSDEQLGAVLASVATHLDLPDIEATSATGLRTVDTPPTDRWRHGRGRRRSLMAAAIVVVALVASLAAAPVRRAVADWLGIGSTRVEIVHEDSLASVPPTAASPPGSATPALPDFLTGVTPIDPAAAAGRLGRSLPAVDALGPADLVAVPPEGGVVLAWLDARTTLWVHVDPDSRVIFTKLLGASNEIERLASIGDDALWLGGTHFFTSPMRRIQAGSTLLWARGDLEYRLEADRSRDDMIRIARSVSG